MAQLDSKKLKHVRNMLILSGIVIGFLIWLAVPSVLSISLLNETGNGYASKLLIVPVLGLPFFALLDTRNRQDIIVKNEEEHALVLEKEECIAAREQVIYAIVEDVIVVAFMTVAIFL